MRINTTVIKRIDDLITEAKAIPHVRGGAYDVYDYASAQEYLKWGTSAMDCLKRVWGSESTYFENFEKSFSVSRMYYSTVASCVGVLEAARYDYNAGYFQSYRSALGSELLSDVLAQGQELLNAHYKDAACVCGRIALETTIKELCAKNAIPHGKLGKMNEDLCKALVYNMGMQKQITAWVDRGNDAAHGNFNNYTETDVKAMFEGIIQFIAAYV